MFIDNTLLLSSLKPLHKYVHKNVKFFFVILPVKDTLFADCQYSDNSVYCGKLFCNVIPSCA